MTLYDLYLVLQYMSGKGSEKVFLQFCYLGTVAMATNQFIAYFSLPVAGDIHFVGLHPCDLYWLHTACALIKFVLNH